LTLKRFEALFSSHAGIEALARHSNMQSFSQSTVSEHQQLFYNVLHPEVQCLSAGGPQLVDMMDTQEMMYDPESGCMMVQVDSYMLLDGGATTMRMRHMKWLYRPVKAEDLTGCEVRLFHMLMLLNTCMCKLVTALTSPSKMLCEHLIILNRKRVLKSVSPRSISNHCICR
jgi:hypothetical protein